MINIMGNALWQLIAQSDTISKLVLVILLIMSIISWAIFFYKWTLFRAKKQQLQEVISRIKLAHSIEEVLEVAARYSGTMPGHFLSKNLAYLKNMLEANKERGEMVLSERQWDLVQQTMDQTIDDIMRHEESYMSILSTSIAAAPLLGLFGTVWGLVHAFIRISEKQSADIVTVAPGIAEALITTLAGLMVAIPALILFNIIHAQMRDLEHKLVILSEKLNGVLQKLFVR